MLRPKSSFPIIVVIITNLNKKKKIYRKFIEIEKNNNIRIQLINYIELN